MKCQRGAPQRERQEGKGCLLKPAGQRQNETQSAIVQLIRKKKGRDNKCAASISPCTVTEHEWPRSPRKSVFVTFGLALAVISGHQSSSDKGLRRENPKIDDVTLALLSDAFLTGIK